MNQSIAATIAAARLPQNTGRNAYAGFMTVFGNLPSFFLFLSSCSHLFLFFPFYFIRIPFLFRSPYVPLFCSFLPV
jgi:hypothetical protein